MFVDIGFSPVPVMIEGFLLVLLQGRFASDSACQREIRGIAGKVGRRSRGRMHTSRP